MRCRYQRGQVARRPYANADNGNGSRTAPGRLNAPENERAVSSTKTKIILHR